MLHILMHHPLIEGLRSRKNLAHVGMFLLRVAVGAVFVYHGYPKLFGSPDKAVMFFSNIHIPFPGFFAPFVGVVEFFGGIMLILGLGARLLGLMLAFNMMVAILTAKGLANWSKYEFELLLMLASLNLFLSGAGPYSLDAWLMERSRKSHEAAMPMPKA